MKRLVRSTLSVLAAFSLLAFVSCGNGEKTATTSTTAKTTGTNATGRSELNVMIEVEIESLDPQLATEGNALEFIANFTDGLKQMNSDGSTVNALCESETVSEDGLVYTFKIRDDAFWSNGDAVKADDFVFAWQRACDPKVASEYSYMMSDIGQIKNAAKIQAGELGLEELGATAVDEKTLRVELEVPVSYFDSLLYFPTFYPMNRAFYEKCGDSYGTSPDTVLSNGAFVLTEYQPASLSLKLVKNDKYYDADKIKVQALNYQILKDSQQALMNYQNGDLDLIKISGDQVDSVKDDPEFLTVGSGFLWYITPNIAKNADLANIHMRRALTFAFERDSIVNEVVKDGSISACVPVPSAYAFNSSGEDFTTKQIPYPELCDSNVERAMAELEEAKKELGKSSFHFTLIVDDTVIQQNVAAVIKDQIESTLEGVDIYIHVEPKKQRLQDMRSGEFELALTRWGPDYADPMTYLGMWVTGNDNNHGEWSNAEYDALIEKCTTGEYCQEPQERWQAMKEASKMILEEAVIFPLYQQSDACMLKSNVKGVDFHAIALMRVFKGVTLQ